MLEELRRAIWKMDTMPDDAQCRKKNHAAVGETRDKCSKHNPIDKPAELYGHIGSADNVVCGCRLGGSFH